MKTLGNVIHVSPKTVNADSLYLVGLVTVVAVLHMMSMAIRVGSARRKYKIDPPQTTGHAGFDLVYRAHQNCLENFPLFMSCLWAAAVFFHQGPAAVFGLCYVVAREMYFTGYSSKAERRLYGFLLSMLCTMALVILVGLGASSAAYRAYRGDKHDFLKPILHMIPVPFL